MLESKYGGRHEYCYLLRIASSFESRSYRNFCFAKSYIPAYETIHGTWRLHVSLYLGGSLLLVWCVFV